MYRSMHNQQFPPLRGAGGIQETAANVNNTNMLNNISRVPTSTGLGIPRYNQPRRISYRRTRGRSPQRRIREIINDDQEEINEITEDYPYEELDQENPEINAILSSNMDPDQQYEICQMILQARIYSQPPL